MTGLLSPVHIALVAVVLLLVFGGRRLPELGRLTGRTIRTRLLGRQPVDPPAALPAPQPAAPGSVPRGAARRSGAAVAAPRPRSVRRRMVFALLRRLPGPLGWIARLLAR
jgi:TatA/E family protein of Tat protein translocase